MDRILRNTEADIQMLTGNRLWSYKSFEAHVGEYTIIEIWKLKPEMMNKSTRPFC